MISEQLIHRIDQTTAQKMPAKAREGRRHALLSISRCCVVLTDDGQDTREVIFDHPPTIEQLAAKVGPDAWIVSIKMRRVFGRSRPSQAIAAE